MGKNTKIIATLVPNGIKSGNELKFSVFLSPRLADSGRLIDYYEILHWQKFAEFFYNNAALSVNVLDRNTNKTIVHSAAIEQDWVHLEKHGLTAKNLNKGKESKAVFESTEKEDFYAFYQKKIWASLFNGYTPVESWLLDEYQKEKVTPLYDQNKLAYDLRRNKKKLVAGLDKYLSTLTPFLVSPIVLATLAELDLNAMAFKDAVSEADKKRMLQELKDAKLLKNFLDFNAQETLVYKRVANGAYSFLQNEGIIILDARHYFAGKEENLEEDEVDRLNKENQEFHKKFSIMADYPHLMRLTGWIFDFTLRLTPAELKELAQSGNLFISFNKMERFEAKETAKGYANRFSAFEMQQFLKEIEFKCPWTAIDIGIVVNGENAVLNSFQFQYKNEDNYLTVKDGYIKTNEGEVSGLKITAEQENRLLVGARLDPDGKYERFTEQDINALNQQNVDPSNADKIEEFQQSEGIGIYISNNDLKTEVGQAAPNQNEDIDEMGIFGQDLDVGYRVDIVDQATSHKVYSLCQRVSSYVVDNNSLREVKIDRDNLTTLLKNFKDEGWIQESHQLDQKGKLIVQDEVARWNNWSLVCPYRGNYKDFNEKEGVEKDRFFHDLEIIDSRPVTGSLPVLKFEHKYRFRLSMVDICGNGVDFEQRKLVKPNSPDTGGVGYWTPEVVYKRKEPVQIPNVFLDHSERTLKDDNILIKYAFKDARNQGEDLHTMVVRSYFKNGDLVAESKNCIRWLAPGRVSFEFMLQTGVLDKLLKNEAYRKDILKHENSKFAGAGHEITVSERDTVQYFWDPVVSGFSYSIESSGIVPQNFAFITDFSPVNDPPEVLAKNLLQAKFGKLSLVGKGVKNLNLKTDGKEIIVELPKGREEKLFVGATNEDNINKNIDGWDAFKINSETDRQLKFRVIHAVQKPIRTTKQFELEEIPFENVLFYNKGVNDINRPPETIVLKPTIEFDLFPVKTVENYRLHITYEKVVIDRNAMNGYRLEIQTKVLGEFFPVGDDPTDRSALLKEINTVFKGDMLTHDFGDTQHRLVDYKIEAISRFRHYFNDKVKDFSIFGQAAKDIDLSDDRQMLVSDRPETKTKFSTNILSSKRPDAPVIDRFVPLIDWREGKNKVERQHNVYRVYFKNEFYSSGLDECIAVFIKEGENTVLDRFNGLISQIGSDPIHGPGKGQRVRNGFRMDHFVVEDAKMKPLIIRDKKPKPDWNFETLSEEQTIPERNERGLNYAILDRNSPSDIQVLTNGAQNSKAYFVGVVPFKLQFDQNLKQWFMDIQLNTSFVDEYMPFVQFALATYQPHAIYSDEYDYRFSKVITTDFAPLLPKRTVTFMNGILTVEGIQILEKTEMWVFAKSANRDGIADLDDRATLGIELKVENGKFTIDTNLDEYRGIKRETLLVEEYESYAELPIAADAEENPTYSPRNDYRKRLVFQCEIN